MKSYSGPLRRHMRIWAGFDHFDIRFAQIPKPPRAKKTRKSVLVSILHVINWLVVWNMTFIFPYIYIYISLLEIIIPSGELRFFRGVGLNHQPVKNHY